MYLFGDPIIIGSKNGTYSYNSEKGLRMMNDQNHNCQFQFSLELAKYLKNHSKNLLE